MSRGAKAVIDLRALRSNLQTARRAAPQSRVMAVVKANGYGHGLLRVAQALEAADALAVASVDEAVVLRDGGISRPIVVLEGCFDQEDLSRAAELDLQLALHAEFQLQLLEQCELSGPVTIWIKIDTGMHRLGFSPESATAAGERAMASGAVSKPLRWMTHLACADDLADSRTFTQLERFADALQGIEGERSIANSAGTLGWPAAQADWVRPGIMLYGSSPFIAGSASASGLKPVMILTTRIIAVTALKMGDEVGYGASWVCPEDMVVGVAAIGYGDGYPRHAPSGTPVVVNGRRHPLIGRVSMDMITIDLSRAPNTQPGDPVELWGAQISVDEVAEAASTISYELLCGVTTRVPVTVVDEES
ncbi:alanine racemase [Solemya pervernicosa gill symbiont]|uniref:Alanine racemase n=2 Tax=Gammaproteobacteria incertae sedis TaxID=118884 RepID=A0A1T2L7P6_9GAMM|nr:alanine racemase [Candidatus Reidiella endopervernicosa]OOZ41103.1 alanine racemase [Solemya pervernicosa gill symbiont]QKQ26267.1 alanine racemase [Candidatus Reidiella endopervernicosa]